MKDEAAWAENLEANSNELVTRSCNARGFTALMQTNFGEAIHCYQKVGELKPNDAGAIGRVGCLYFDLGDFGNSLKNLRKEVELAPGDPDCRLRIWLSRARSGEGEAAAAGLQAWLAGRKAPDSDDWPSNIARFLLGQMSEPELLKLAKQVDPHGESGCICGAFFYAGEKRLIAGDREGAGDCFEKSTEAGVNNQTGYWSAIAELKRLKP